VVIGDALNAIKEAKHKISGEIELDGSQFNFYIEGIISVVEPTEDGYKSKSNQHDSGGGGMFYLK
jgi:xanthine dehydrogenase molybdopterin-binding subunit B